MKTMNIDAKEGDKVKYKYPNGGYSFDIETGKHHLKLGEIYTVERTVVHSFSTEVYLKEKRGVRFNSCLFEDA